VTLAAIRIPTDYGYLANTLTAVFLKTIKYLEPIAIKKSMVSAYKFLIANLTA
jgi:hypothetical protein